MKVLAFPLHGAFAAWGDIAVGPHRPTYAAPSRSSVLGLLAAGLGYARDADDLHAALDEGIGCGVAAHVSGSAQSDYHTAQARARSERATYFTRDAEISGPARELTTVLSQRDYLADSLFSVALWRRADVGPTLDEIRTALLQPRYALSLGRRAFPISWPIVPEILDVARPDDAFQRVVPEALLRKLNAGKDALPFASAFFDEMDARDFGLNVRERFEQRDRPGARSRREFRMRRVVRVAPRSVAA